MGIAALILGIISLICSFIPFCGIIAFLPALVGLILGIVDIVLKSKQQKSKGVSIAGTIISAIAIVVIFIWLVILPLSIASTGTNLLEDGTDRVNDITRQLEQQLGE